MAMFWPWRCFGRGDVLTGDVLVPAVFFTAVFWCRRCFGAGGVFYGGVLTAVFFTAVFFPAVLYLDFVFLRKTGLQNAYNFGARKLPIWNLSSLIFEPIFNHLVAIFT